MLLILGWWLSIKHEDLSRLVVLVIWLLAIASFGGGIWQYLALTSRTASPAAPAAGKERRVLGVGLAAGGVILLGLALYLGVSFKLAAFGEVAGMGLLALIALASGYRLLKGERTGADTHPFFDFLRRHHAYVGLSMVVVGGLLAVAALVLVFVVKAGGEYFPETAGMFLLGALGVGGGSWLIVSQSDQLTTAKMRVFVLIVGGIAGLILSLAALAQAILWRDEVFGGMRAWQGDRGWRLWLCAYALLIGLALMFASLQLARTDIRSSAVLRRILYGYNAVLTGLLLLAMLVVVNIVFFALVPFSFEWSKSRGAHSLSTSTKNLLSNLRQPTTLYVFAARGKLDNTELRNFLDNCESQSTQIRVKYVSPDKDFEEYDKLAQRFPETLANRKGGRVDRSDRGILIVYGELPADADKKPPHAFLTFASLVEEVPIRGNKDEMRVTLAFKGEAEIMKELSFLAQDRKKRKIYFLQGNGELDIKNNEDDDRRNLRKTLDEFGCAILVEGLKKEQLEVQGLSFGEAPAKDAGNITYAKASGTDKRKDVPDDADTLVIAGASVPVEPKTIDALERYMDRGGKLLVFLDVVLDAKGTGLVTTGLEAFLRKYGVLVGSDFPLRITGEDPRVVFATAPRDTTNELAAPFVTDPAVPVRMRTARVVRPDPSAQKYKSEVILQLDPRFRVPYMEENSARVLENPVTYLKELDSQGTLVTRLSGDPIPVGVAVSEKLVDPGTGKENLKPRLVVFGDAECIGNFDIVRPRNNPTFSWVASALEWMAEKKGLIGARPKETSSYSLNPQVVNLPRLEYLPGWLMMLSVLSLGAGIWVVRRR
jgi:hypothetical protein